MSHINDELARQTRRVLDNNGWSLRDAFAVSGLQPTTISVMSRGLRVSEQTLRRWAIAIGEPVEDWLRYGGYQYVPDTSAPPSVTPVDTSRADNPIEQLLDQAEALHNAAKRLHAGTPTALKNWHELTHEQRERINQAIEDALKEPSSDR